MEKTVFKLLVGALVALSFVACTKEKIDEVTPRDQNVIVINGGNYTEHSASISIYNEVNGTMQNRMFEQANGFEIGATIISGAAGPNKEAFLICNFPDKIEIIDSKTAKILSDPISTGLANPRAAVVTDTRIYVTNWDYDHIVEPDGYWSFSGSYVTVYDLQTKELVKQVLVGSDAEGLLLYGNNLFVATKEGVRVLDVTGDAMTLKGLIRSSDVTGGAKHLAIDKNSMLWASFPDKGVIQINPNTLTVTKVVEVPVESMDGFITSDVNGENIYTYSTTYNSSYTPESASIYAVNTTTGSVSTIFSGRYFYGVGVSPSTGNIFTAEVGFSSNSLLKVVSPAGEEISSAVAGIGTNRYLFF